MGHASSSHSITDPPTKRFARMALAAVLLVVAACSSDSTPDPTTATLTISASDQLNPNADNAPSPVVVIVYELRSKSAFDAAEFNQLFYEARGTLGGDLLGIQELEVSPALKAERALDFSPETRFLGVVAGYRNLGNATWRASVPITPEEENPVQLTVDSLAISLRIPEGSWFGLF